MSSSTISSSDVVMEQQPSLTPPSLDFPAPKFELGGGDINVQSPDNAIWDSILFSDQFDSSDFMIMSPVRNLLPSPQLQFPAQFNYNYAQAMQGQSLSGASPPRSSSQLGLSTSFSHKGKGLSPLHKVFSSVNNQYMQHPENFSVPPLEELLEDYQREHHAGFDESYNSNSMAATSKMSAINIGGGSSSRSSSYVDLPEASVDEGLLEMTSFCGEDQSSERDKTASYQMERVERGSSSARVPLSQQLEQERQREKKQQQQQQQRHNLHQNIAHNNLMTMNTTIPIASDLQV